MWALRMHVRGSIRDRALKTYEKRGLKRTVEHKRQSFRPKDSHIETNVKQRFRRRAYEADLTTIIRLAARTHVSKRTPEKWGERRADNVKMRSRRATKTDFYGRWRITFSCGCGSILGDSGHDVEVFAFFFETDRASGLHCAAEVSVGDLWGFGSSWSWFPSETVASLDWFAYA